uniref:Uncharacterized protein n=1 Tax=Anguilla anguilla TaxID=7936 RepID=A0A0E9XLF1_ANGAN
MLRCSIVHKTLLNIDIVKSITSVKQLYDPILMLIS